MNFETLAKHAGLQPEIMKSILTVQNTACDTATLKALFWQNRQTFFNAVKASAVKNKIDVRILYGYLYIDLAADAYASYQTRAICDEVYYDTMHDIAIWAENCHAHSGVWGIAEIEWLSLHVSLQIFRLGRLQFQPIVFALPEGISAAACPLQNGDAVYNVHIPKGGKLLPIECEKSYDAAAKFFKQEHPAFVCYSWLLHSALQTLLPPTSNLLMFQKRYHIFKESATKANSIEAERIIFGRIEENPVHYPQQTQLQKSVVAYLKSGRQLGNGSGYFIG
ncbi:MAG: acyltransferase domain-containing protein [Ruthenibacterium sp.]